MKRLALCIIFLFIFAIPVFSQNIKVTGIASKGGKIVRTSALVQHTLMETYPSCTVTVYQTGTLTLASIFSDEIGTPKSNPFTANTDASWFFYVAAGRYDIKFSGTGILIPFTISDVFVDTGGGGGGGDVTSVFGRTGAVVAQSGDYDFNQLDFTGSNFNSIVTRSASDLNAGTLPDARFPAILPAISGINLINLNASNLASGTVDDARLSANVPLKNAANTFTQNNLFMANLGINTLTPDRRLEVLDGSSAQLRLTAVDNSVYTDLFVDSGGTLNVIPTGNVAFNSAGKQVNPTNTFDQNLGQINKKWLSLHAAELFVETLVAQNTIATIGGRILVAPTNVLIADLSSANTVINVKYNNFANGDRVYLEGNSSVEFMAVISGATVIPGGFSYTVTRNLDGTGANDWFAGDAILNTGVAGDGFIDLYSIRGVKAATQIGPTIVGNVRNSSTYNDWTENWAIGNLNGIYGYGVDTYGAAFGKYGAGFTHVTIDATNGYRVFDGLATVRTQIANDGSGFLANNNINWDASGNATIAGWSINATNINSGTTYIASNFDAPIGPIAWFGKSAAGFSGMAIRDSSNREIDVIVGQSTIFPYFHMSDGTRARIVIGGLNNNWGSDGLTNSMGMKIWSSAGAKLVEFSDAQNIIGGWSISADTISSTGINIKSGASAHIAFGTTPPTAANSGTGIFIDRTGLYGLNANAQNFILNASNGNITAVNANISGTITATSGSLSGLSITGALTMSGAGASIALGATPPTSCTSGTGIFIDRTAICSVNAGHNIAKLDFNGIKLANTTSFTSDPLVFSYNGNDAGYIRAFNDGSIRVLGQTTSTVAQVKLQATETTNSRTVSFDIYTTSSNTNASLSGNNLTGLTIGDSTTAQAMLDIRSDKIRISTAKTPASATEACTQGTIAWDANFVYVCVATDTWKRTAIATW